MAIRRTDRLRLARLAGPRLGEARDAVEDRAKLRNRLCFFRRVALLLAVAEVDPERTCIARRLDEAEAALAAIPDTPELAKADEAYLACLDTRSIGDWQTTPRYRPPRRVEGPVKSAIERLMTRYRTDLTDIDLATHSPVELFAWCLSQHGESYDEAAAAAAKAAENLLLRFDAERDETAPAAAERADLPEHTQ
ncbi:MAG: hypothetical protein E6G85_00855 [Alphaproteobacteria bacterium]|nr:MAG: hypothetical protein E6G85_00855 [Alphaproteobacteria bacterium]